MSSGVEVCRLSRRFGDRTALEDVSFEARPGEIFGCLGPNGAGKTTLLRILLGLLSPSGGYVRVAGADPNGAERGFRRRVGALLDSPGVYGDLSVLDNLRFYGDIYRIVEPDRRIARLVDFVGLRARMNTLASRLSKGLRQKLALARMLLHDPSLLFFDEPTAGIDPLFQREMREKILTLAEKGKTTFLSSHNLAEVQEVCTQVAFMKEGRCLSVGSIDDAFECLGREKFEILLSDGASGPEVRSILSPFGKIRRSRGHGRLELLLSKRHQGLDPGRVLRLKGVRVDRVQSLPVTLDDVFESMMEERSTHD